MERWGLYTKILKVMALAVWPLFMVSCLFLLTALPFETLEAVFSQADEIPSGVLVADVASTLYYSVVMWVFTGFGCLKAFILSREILSTENRRFVASLRAAVGVAVSALVFGGAMALTLSYGNSPFELLCLAPAVVAFIVADRHFYLNYRDILTSAWIGSIIIIPTIVTIVLQLNDLETFTLPLAIIFLVQLSTQLLVQGQGNIDFMMERRKHRLQHLPNSIRRYVFLLTGVVITILALVLLFRDQIAAAVSGLGSVLYALIGLLLSLLPSIYSQEETAQETTTVQQGDMGLGGSENPYSDLIDLISIIILVLVIVALIYRYRTQLLSLITGILLKIIAAITKLLSPTPLATMFKSPESSYYVDSENRIDPNYLSGKGQKKQTFREWRKQYAKFLKMPPSVEKYRLGYRLTMERLMIEEVAIAPSDTPFEILKKAEKILPHEEWRGITDCYSRVRYSENDNISNEELNRLADAIDRMN